MNFPLSKTFSFSQPSHENHDSSLSNSGEGWEMIMNRWNASLYIPQVAVTVAVSIKIPLRDFLIEFFCHILFLVIVLPSTSLFLWWAVNSIKRHDNFLKEREKEWKKVNIYPFPWEGTHSFAWRLDTLLSSPMSFRNSFILFIFLTFLYKRMIFLLHYTMTRAVKYSIKGLLEGVSQFYFFIFQFSSARVMAE